MRDSESVSAVAHPHEPDKYGNSIEDYPETVQTGNPEREHTLIGILPSGEAAAYRGVGGTVAFYRLINDEDRERAAENDGFTATVDADEQVIYTRASAPTDTMTISAYVMMIGAKVGDWRALSTTAYEALTPPDTTMSVTFDTSEFSSWKTNITNKLDGTTEVTIDGAGVDEVREFATRLLEQADAAEEDNNPNGANADAAAD